MGKYRIEKGVNLTGYWHTSFENKFKTISQEIKTNGSKISLEASPDPFMWYRAEIALCYFFLHQWVESFLNDTIRTFHEHTQWETGQNRFKKFLGKKLNLSGKLGYLFENFCQDLPFSSFVRLKSRLKDIVKARHMVAHLEEIAWGAEFENLEERPTDLIPVTKLARLATPSELENAYIQALQFFKELRTILSLSKMGSEKHQNYENTNKYAVKYLTVAEKVFEGIPQNLIDEINKQVI